MGTFLDRVKVARRYLDCWRPRPTRLATILAMNDEQFRVIRGLLVPGVILLGFIAGILLAFAWCTYDYGRSRRARVSRGGQCRPRKLTPAVKDDGLKFALSDLAPSLQNARQTIKRRRAAETACQHSGLSFQAIITLSVRLLCRRAAANSTGRRVCSSDCSAMRYAAA